MAGDGQPTSNWRSPYNTYLNKGLTPTPICFPSRAALQAALNPPAGSWLYFVVVQSDGTEAFADTFAEQQANEALAKQRGAGLSERPDCRDADHRRSSPAVPAVGGHRGGRGDRGPGRPLPLAPAAQHRVRRARARLGVGGFPGGGRTRRARPWPVPGPWASAACR